MRLLGWFRRGKSPVVVDPGSILVDSVTTAVSEGEPAWHSTTFNRPSRDPFVSLPKHKRKSPQRQAIEALTPGTWITFPCQWPHKNPRSHCEGHETVGKVRRATGRTFTARCRDGVFTVMEVE